MEKVEPLGDCGLLIEFGEEISQDVTSRIAAFSTQLAATPVPGMIEFIPGYTTITIFYDPFQLRNSQQPPYLVMKNYIEGLLKNRSHQTVSKTTKRIDIPVCYGGKFGPDIQQVANFHSITIDEVIEIHTKEEYTVAMIGFAPGFPYLTGMNETIATPRLKTPRKLVCEGSVGIAGKQTGIYSITSPGGWQIIGRTPVSLFDIQNDPPTLVRQGDKVGFYSITEQEFQLLQEENNNDPC